MSVIKWLLFLPTNLFGGALAVGAGKELHDYLRPETNTPDVLDFIATVLGAVVGAAPFLMR